MRISEILELLEDNLNNSEKTITESDEYSFQKEAVLQPAKRRKLDQSSVTYRHTPTLLQSHSADVIPVCMLTGFQNDRYLSDDHKKNDLVIDKNLHFSETYGVNFNSNIFFKYMKLYVHYTKGIDVQVDPGLKKNIIALTKSARDYFYQCHPTIKKILLRNECNPIVEEGAIDDKWNGDRDGELFLTDEALTLLVKSEIVEKHLADIRYDVNNIYIVNDCISKKSLGETLSALKLFSGDNAKFIYIYDIHAISIYLRYEKNTLRAFILDSDPMCYSRRNIVKVLCENNVDEIFISHVPLQKDLYSCSTFSLKFIAYFCKYGDMLFSELQQQTQETEVIENKSCISLSTLPWRLLKYSQCISVDDLNNESYSYLLPRKTPELFDYWKKNTFQSDDKRVFNIAALKKRYKSLNGLESWLIHRGFFAKDISENSDHPLPSLLIDKMDERDSYIAKKS